MVKKNIKTEDIQHFYKAILSLQTVEQCAAFFDDLCTVKEVEQMSERLHAAKLLLEGKTYAQVIADTDISSATLSRVSRCVQYGKGYTSVLNETEPEKQ